MTNCLIFLNVHVLLGRVSNETVFFFLHLFRDNLFINLSFVLLECEVKQQSCSPSKMKEHQFKYFSGSESKEALYMRMQSVSEVKQLLTSKLF